MNLTFPGVCRTLTSIVAAGALLAGGTAAWASNGGGPADIRGVYDATSHVGSASYPQVWHVTSENLATGVFSGVDTSPAGSFTVTGKVTGNTLTVTVSQGGYVSHGTATITVSGGQAHISGKFVDSNGTTGTWASAFTPAGGSKPGPTTTATTPTTTTTTPGAKRPTFTAVVCNISVVGSSSCAAQVADASPQRSNPPTGTVDLSATSGIVGSSCTLAGTPGSPGIASCTVSYQPSANLVQGEPPPVSAHYLGDAVFAPSSGSSSFYPASVLVPGTPSSTDVALDQANLDGYPVDISDSLSVDADVNTTMLRAGARSAAAPKGKLIGKASFHLKPLASIATKIKLNATGRRLLAKHKKLSVTLTVTTKAAGKTTKTVSRQIVIKSG